MGRTNNKTSRQTFKDAFKLGDVLVLVVLLVLVALTIAFALKSSASYAEVYIDGELKYTLDLSSDTTLEILDGKMTLCVEDGKIRVADSDCSQKLCAHSGAISKDGGMIVCLPNKVVIKVSAGEVDAIT